MQQQVEAYQNILKQLLNLQQQLIHAFETEVEIIPPSHDFMNKIGIGIELAHIDWTRNSISHIIQIWPVHRVPLPLVIFVRPRKGIIHLEGQNWLFVIHGSAQVSFIRLSNTLDADILEQVKRGNTDVLIGLPGGEASIDVQYLKEGRTDGVSPWSVSVFAVSIDSEFSHLSESEHQSFLEILVDAGILLPWPDLRGQQNHFIFAVAKGEAELAGK